MLVKRNSNDLTAKQQRRAADTGRPNFFKGIVAGLVAAGVGIGTIAPAQAEGSRNLFQSSNGFRANLEWRSVQYVNLLRRRTLLRVYARQGEFILLGSSAMGVNAGDILVYNPGLVSSPTLGDPSSIVGNEQIPATSSYSCVGQRTTTGNDDIGFIGDRTQELAGPRTITNPANGTPGAGTGYVPCYYQAPQDGIYTVVVLGPAGDNVDRPDVTPPTGAISPLQNDQEQDTSVAAWDVTVRSSLTTPVDITGRLFTYYLTLFTGNNDRPLPNESTLFTLTIDGFIYRTQLNGIDPNGFVVYGNRQGFLNTDQRSPLNRDIVAAADADDPNQLTAIQGGVSIARPEFPLFFNNPDSAVISALGIPTPQEPVVISGSFSFSGSAGANNSTVGQGGTFTYQANVQHVYELILSRDGSNFDPTNPQNRVLRGIQTAGATTVNWDGLDNSGTAFPVGSNYQARIVIRAGEYHFPLLDVESSPNGSPFYELVNPPGPNCLRGSVTGRCTAGFYDDRGYRTANGNVVGTINEALPSNANTPPNPPNSNLLTGFDTFSQQRRFVGSGSRGFGDQKGLDLWTYYPSPPALTPFNIVDAGNADLRLTKTVDNPGANEGDTVTYTIALTNDGPATATNVTVSDVLPAGLVFVSATPSVGTFDSATGVWTVPSIANGASVTLQIAATLNAGAGASPGSFNPLLNTAEITAADQPDPNTNNNRDTARVGAPNLRLVKRITAVTRNGVPTTFSQFVDDPGNTNDTAAGWSSLSPVGVPRIGPADPLRSGDEVEYTIYFLSDGRQPVLGTSVCDPVPPGTSLIPNSSQIQRGTGTPLPGGTPFSPLAPLPAGNSCPDQTNRDGAVIFDLGDVPSTPGSNVGFVRFRARIN
ncbi:DUF11 domain-containing protein [Leptolyngbya sp. FACHB-36]|uniref:DUF11 domain-containing protein n=1 Tax=Leptolyngbya sp. FACHB-36 TaxID=2692808 RepID=UPI001680AC42|nr:DUF11 domain-containing protein [Leptolyngbya sp. FACHB-36]MBD2021176.1 DUF11 domain-containing protein [Leptolyngbya sp. FACHB-36]